MKKIVYILCAMFALASCTKEELPTTDGQNADGTYTFNLGVEEINTRATVSMGRYVMEMYEGDLTATPTKQSNSTGVFNVDLKKGIDYVCLFWADNGTEAYDATNLKAVKQTNETKQGTAAYFAKAAVNSKTFNGAVTLKRAVAELSFIDTNGLTEATSTLKITYPYASTTFNLGDGTVTHAAGSAVRTIAGITPPADKATAFTTDYILAPTTAGKLAGLKFQLNAEEEKTIAETAIKANVKTKITGEYFTPLPSMSFTIDLSAYSTDKSYILPFDTSDNRPYTLTVDWGDGHTETIAPTASLAARITHTYADAKTYQITITSSQKDSTKEQVPDFRPMANQMDANNAKKLKSMDTPMLNIGSAAAAAAAGFYSTFAGCTGLISIHAELFANNTAITNFSYCFAGCTGLGSIPAELFAKNTKAIGFNCCFYACTGLGSIPAELFADNTAVTDFAYCFYACTGLGSIPAELFANNTAVTDFSSCFSGCTGLGSIPAGLFASNTKVINFSSCFSGCTGLSGSIPAKLFDNNTAVITFEECFYDCTKLSGEIPAELFAKNMEATNFFRCFGGCLYLALNPDIFCVESTETMATRFAGKEMDLTNCFAHVGKKLLAGNGGTAPALWMYNIHGAHQRCFAETNATNNADIPNNWK